MRLGIHTFTSGSLEKAAARAGELGAETFQIFSASPRMWWARELDPVQVKLFRATHERFGLRPLAIHAGYLINLASADPGDPPEVDCGLAGRAETGRYYRSGVPRRAFR